MSKGKRTKRRGLSAAMLPLALLGVAAILAGGLLNIHGWGTLEAKATAGLEDVRISEVQNHNALTLPGIDGASWIELENTGDAPVSLRGLCLTRDSKLNKTLVFPDVTLEAGGFLLIYADGSARPGNGEALHAPFRLPKSGAHELFLYDAAQRLLDSVSVPVMQADESWCRNERGEWVVTDAPSPGGPYLRGGGREDLAQSGDVVLNEMMCANVALFPDENGEVHDYVELINRGEADVDLEGYSLSDNAAKPTKWRFPRVILPAGGVLAVHCSGEDRREDPAHLHASFRLSKGETVYLSQPNGATASVVTLPELQTGQAFSRTPDGEWVTDLPPTPNRPNTLDAALRMDGENRTRRAGGVYISEVMAQPVDEKSDWVELYNDADIDVDLSGWGLSDNPNRVRKWQFPTGTTIDAHGYLAVFLTGGSQAAPANYLSAPFALPAEGGCTLSLCDASGRVLDSLYLPRQYPGMTFGRSDGGDCGFLSAATPLAANGSGALLGPAANPRYSVMGGLYSSGDSFSVTMTVDPGARLYYTLDCSDPGEDKTLYDGAPIPISGTTILRTRVYQDGHLPSVMDTQSYLFDVNAASEVPYVISLVSDPVGLYSDETGIMAMGPNAREEFPYGNYGKGANFWMDWEREAHVELFTGAGDTAISQECGIKLHGRNTRAYKLKSFKVMAKSRYGASMFRYPIFRDRPYDEYEAFILRYSGQDYRYAFMRDVVMSKLAANTSVMYMEAMECIVFLNGEYYSAMYIRENISPFSLARREGWTGQEDAVDLVKSNDEVKQGSNESYKAFLQYLAEHDCNTQEVYDRIDREVDIDNFIDYMTLYIVYKPPDTVNVKRYRNQEADGKWRWVLYDLDRAMRDDYRSGSGFKLMAQGINAQLFKAFMTNDALRERFLANLNTALATYLSSESMTQAVKAQFERVKPLLPDYLANLEIPQSKYKSRLNDLLLNAKTRPALVLKHCAAFFHFSDEEMRARFADAYAAIEAFEAR